MTRRRRHDDPLRKEFRRQVKGFPREAVRQLFGFDPKTWRGSGQGWGNEIAHQIFGTPRHRRRGSR